MKKSYSLLIIGIFFSYSLQSQNPQWLNYTVTVIGVYASASEGNYIWAGTCGGIAKINTITGEIEFYNKADSGLPDNDVRSIAIDAEG